MTYSLPKESFAWLSHLQVLDISRNRLQGTIPDTVWSSLTDLTTLSMGYNQLQGRLPTTLQQLSVLEYLRIDGNLLTGSLPLFLPGQGSWHDPLDDGLNKNNNKTSSTTVTRLKLLSGESNQFTGSIPLTWWNNVHSIHNNGTTTTTTTTNTTTYVMNWLNLGYNFLTGTIPTQIGLWTRLELLVLTLNGSMNGTLPTELGRLSRLGRLSLAENQFSGTLPFAYILPLPNLEWFTVSNNNLMGTIPSTALIRDDDDDDDDAYDWKMISWSMHNNALSGTLPTELGLITSLKLVQFSTNQFQGTIPTHHLEYGWTNVETFWIFENPQLQGEMPCNKDDGRRGHRQSLSNTNHNGGCNNNNNNKKKNNNKINNNTNSSITSNPDTHDDDDDDNNNNDNKILDYRADCLANPWLVCFCCIQCY
jgi:Leucine rich repeat